MDSQGNDENKAGIGGEHMNRDTQEYLFEQYLLGQLSSEESEALESRLRNDVCVREHFFAVQQAFEERVVQIQQAAAGEASFAFEGSRAKAAIFGKLGMSLEPDLSDGLSSQAASRVMRSSWLWRFFPVAGLGIAAALVVMMAFWGSQWHRTSDSGNFIPAGPAIVVYDILDGDRLDVSSLKKDGNVKEVLYVNTENYDGLARAEAYAEQLWSEYQKEKTTGLGHSITESRGFLVFDLIGKQGFAGFYDDDIPTGAGEPLPEVGRHRGETLWFAAGSARKDVSLGPLSGETGVFYFQVKDDELSFATLNAFIPVTRSEKTRGI